MRIGILETGYPPPEVIDTHGRFAVLFEALLAGYGFTFDVYDLQEMQFPTGPEAAEGWLITGSRHGAYEDHAFIPPLEDLIRDIAAAGKPLVGICFGHQIIAQAMGGKVEKYSGGWAIGHHAYRDADLGEVALTAWHQDQVVRVPEGARVTATSPFCDVAGLVYGDKIYTVQPHPEFSGDILKAYSKAKRVQNAYPPEMIAGAVQAADLPLDQKAYADQIAGVLKGTFVPSALEEGVAS